MAKAKQGSGPSTLLNFGAFEGLTNVYILRVKLPITLELLCMALSLFVHAGTFETTTKNIGWDNSAPGGIHRSDLSLFQPIDWVCPYAGYFAFAAGDIGSPWWFIPALIPFLALAPFLYQFF